MDETRFAAFGLELTDPPPFSIDETRAGDDGVDKVIVVVGVVALGPLTVVWLVGTSVIMFDFVVD